MNGKDRGDGPLWTLNEIASATSGALTGGGDGAVSGVSIDSRTVEPGQAFFAIAGDRFDGHDFVAAALRAGAAATHGTLALKMYDGGSES